MSVYQTLSCIRGKLSLILYPIGVNFQVVKTQQSRLKTYPYQFSPGFNTQYIRGPLQYKKIHDLRWNVEARPENRHGLQCSGQELELDELIRLSNIHNLAQSALENSGCFARDCGGGFHFAT